MLFVCETALVVNITFSAALPLYSVSRGFCKTLLCDTLDALLLKDPTHSVLESANEAFKWTLGIAKALNAQLLAKHGSQLSAVPNDSGEPVSNTALTYVYTCVRTVCRIDCCPVVVVTWSGCLWLAVWFRGGQILLLYY